MKKYLYKYPLISVILSNIITAFIILFSLNNDKCYFLSVIIINLYINNWVLNKGISITKTKIILMSMSFYVMLLISILCNKYMGIIKM
ncbi:MAG: hypothetical protein E6423_13125 [Clostridium sp.]|uniref:hypothetical protein n=1 Tax=Clostridium paraputrificum TaxID=29363 RepID=UPI00196B0DDF|nr:hypothetical protein [Clostridium paraputrificum]MDU6809712.1 hypothetical protein [Clostridium sp.]